MLSITSRITALVFAIITGIVGYIGASWWWDVYTTPKLFLSQLIVDLSNATVAFSVVMFILTIFLFLVVYEGRY